MCWTSSECKIQIAKEDITCYKVASKLTDTCFKSMYYHFLYTFDRFYGEPLECKYGYDKFFIEKGFHSFNIIYTAIHNLERAGDVILGCTIPRGTEYAFSEEQQSYVSQDIIIEKVIPIYMIGNKTFDDITKASEFALDYLSKHNVEGVLKTKYSTMLDVDNKLIKIKRYD